MRSIKGSKFIIIDSGEQQSFMHASSALAIKATRLTEKLETVMPIKLVKVEVISIDKPNVSKSLGLVKPIWIATGLMVKL